jgi:hypothetical protein
MLAVGPTFAAPLVHDPRSLSERGNCGSDCTLGESLPSLS